MESKKAIKGYSGPYRGRNDYYRDGSYILMLIVNFQAILIGILTIALSIYLSTRHSNDHYYAETVEGKLMPLISLGHPNMGMQTRAEWAATAASDILTFGFNDKDVHFAKVRAYFTSEGWDSFNKALEASKLIEAIMKTQQIVTAVPRGVPVLREDGLIKGKLRWVVDVPLLITFRAGSDIRPIPKKVHMEIESLPTRENPFGWGISNWELN